MPGFGGRGSLLHITKAARQKSCAHTRTYTHAQTHKHAQTCNTRTQMHVMHTRTWICTFTLLHPVIRSHTHMDMSFTHSAHTRTYTHAQTHTNTHRPVIVCTLSMLYAMHACIYARMHICIRTTQCTHACIHAYIYKCMHACARFCFACVRVLHVRIYHFSSSRVLLIMRRRTAQHGAAESSNDKRAPQRHDPPSTRWLG